ncbi:glycosyltransferase family 4 protein [Streptomyces genisteinicus]|uniref:Glycosyltransferase family 4 protein n=1 Tax=Streptomyces genisteinicus TaxID=2768068 RepID=A0A7H0HQW5_9ACTN|nr:glycosyltransferase family 4 protein [Streptomyces genisteinicus]QNP62931.1 glycosyltransferase family 4 protein [Streptomyces genisteinicus]
MNTILQITAYYPPQLGGIERVAESLVAGLGRHHDVRVVTTTLGSGAAPRHVRDGRVTVLRHRAVEFAHTAIAPGVLLSLLRAPRGSVMHVHAPFGLFPELVALAARVRRQRFVVHYHLDAGASGPLGVLLPAYKKHVLGRVLRAAAAVIVLTERQSAFVRERYGVRPERVFVVPNGVGGDYFMPPRPVTGRPLRLLFVGRLCPQKNVGRLLDALRLARQPVALRVVGDGEQRAGLQARAARLGLDVTFAGPLHGPDLVRAYAEADAFVLSSDREGMALSALEAMAASLPVVATDVPGNTELLRGVGLLAAPEPAALAAAVDRVASDPALRTRLARRSARAATAYSWEAAVRRVEDVYARALP